MFVGGVSSWKLNKVTVYMQILHLPSELTIAMKIENTILGYVLTRIGLYFISPAGGYTPHSHSVINSNESE